MFTAISDSLLQECSFFYRSFFLSECTLFDSPLLPLHQDNGIILKVVCTVRSLNVSATLRSCRNLHSHMNAVFFFFLNADSLQIQMCSSPSLLADRRALTVSAGVESLSLPVNII